MQSGMSRIPGFRFSLMEKEREGFPLNFIRSDVSDFISVGDEEQDSGTGTVFCSRISHAYFKEPSFSCGLRNVFPGLLSRFRAYGMAEILKVDVIHSRMKSVRFQPSSYQSYGSFADPAGCKHIPFADFQEFFHRYIGLSVIFHAYPEDGVFSPDGIPVEFFCH